MSAILNAIAGFAACRPSQTALSDGTDALSYRDLSWELEKLTASLGDACPEPLPIAVCAENSMGWVLLDLALIKLGRPSIPLPTFFTPAQLHHALHTTGAKTLISDRLLPTRKCSGALAVLGRNFFLYDENERFVDLPNNTGKITFTSGTTGTPKGVCLSQAGMERIAESLVNVIGVEHAGTHCAILSLAVLLENVAGLYTTFLAGGQYHVPAPAAIGFSQPFQPDYSALVDALQQCGATSAIMVPEILRGTLDVLAGGMTSLPAMKLVAVGGSKISPALLAKAEVLGLPLYQGYGLSEAASVVSLNTAHNNRPGSVGRPLPHIGLEIAPDGEILLHRPAFLGYVGGDPASRVLATGDIGRFDDSGYLYIEGRKSNVLITAFGRNVAPEWVESEMISQPAIKQAMVFGDGTLALGALIVPSSAATSNVEIAKAIRRANQNLPDYANVSHWAIIPPFTPANGQLTVNGRLIRETIRQKYQKLMESCLGHPEHQVTFFEQLVAATEPEREYLRATPQLRDGLLGRISRETYLEFLTQAYHHVKHTVALLTLAGEKMPPEKTVLRDALDQYIDEESGHDGWILDDIKAAGGNAAAVRNGTPRLATELMVAYAYDYVERINPVGIFGMIYVLESTSAQLASQGANALIKALQLPENCFRYLHSHGALDRDHILFFQNLMSKIQNPADRAAITHIARRMYILYGNVLRSIPHKLSNLHVL